MKTVHFRVDPIFVIRRLTEIIHESSENVHEQPVNDILYLLTDQEYGILLDEFLKAKYIEKENNTINVSKIFVEKFYTWLIKKMKKDIDLYDLIHEKGNGYIYDKNNKEYIIFEIANHTWTLATLLYRDFKDQNNIKKEELVNYIEGSYELHKCYAKISSIDDAIRYMMSYHKDKTPMYNRKNHIIIKEKELFKHYLKEIKKWNKEELECQK